MSTSETPTGKARQYITRSRSSAGRHSPPPRRRFGRKGFVAVAAAAGGRADARPVATTTKHDGGAGVTPASPLDGRTAGVFHPSGSISASQSGRRLIRPTVHSPRPPELNPINFRRRRPSFVESERPVVPPNAGAGRVKIKANLSHALRYQFPATCRPDVGVYHPPRPIYRMFRTISHSSRNLSSH